MRYARILFHVALFKVLKARPELLLVAHTFGSELSNQLHSAEQISVGSGRNLGRIAVLNYPVSAA